MVKWIATLICVLVYDLVKALCRYMIVTSDKRVADFSGERKMSCGVSLCIVAK